MREARAAGLSVPLPDEEEVKEELGGFAYEMLFLSFRLRPELHLVGDELEGFFENTLKPKQERLVDVMEPIRGDYLAHHEALEAYRQYKRFGLPHSGGYQEQSASWLYMMKCAFAAEERAESLNQREEALYSKQKADQATQDQAAV